MCRCRDVCHRPVTATAAKTGKRAPLSLCRCRKPAATRLRDFPHSRSGPAPPPSSCGARRRVPGPPASGIRARAGPDRTGSMQRLDPHTGGRTDVHTTPCPGSCDAARAHFPRSYRFRKIRHRRRPFDPVGASRHVIRQRPACGPGLSERVATPVARALSKPVRHGSAFAVRVQIGRRPRRRFRALPGRHLQFQSASLGNLFRSPWRRRMGVMRR